MDKPAAVKIIKDTFEAPFDRNRYVYLVKNLLKNLDDRTEGATFKLHGQYITDAFKPYIKKYERVGKYEDTKGSKIDALIVYLQKETSLERARTMQRNFVSWYLKGSRGGVLKDAALVAFVSPDHDDWRFSLVKMEYHLQKSDKGEVKPEKELTPARRCSFLVGESEKSHTAKSQLLPLLEDNDLPTLAELEEAFSVEKVTKEFFEKYHQLFHDVKEGLDKLLDENPTLKEEFENRTVNTAGLAKKLLGQIVFLYFLQKKGWFGVDRDKDWGTGPKDFLRRLFEKKVAKYENFFNEVLEPLFYEALATERSQDFYSRFNCKIPFLNGGLFDPLNDYDWVHTDILLPNTLFSNDRKTKEGDVGDGILDIFDRYNFTVREDEPLEKEVAVDPEMLGKVFENLLEVKDRKSKGTYYTPREIVHYMCQESLINHLITESGLEEETIRSLVNPKVLIQEDYHKFRRKGGKKEEVIEGALALWASEAEKLDNALTNVLVCDPACGSGAFLVGMLQEIINARKRLASALNSEVSNYELKKHAIAKCLYGVDIDPGAVEIAKLRLWLSLVVEEESIKNIRPLPNLDYKVMQGNSLLEEYEGVMLFDSESVDTRQEDFLEIVSEAGRLTKDLQKLKEDFFKASLKSDKDKLKTKIEDLTWGLIEASLKEQGKKDKLEELAQFKKSNTKPFFLWHLDFAEVFQDKGGFDVVIANPPYVSSWNMAAVYKKIYTKKYVAAVGHYDLYILFFELGLNLAKQGGIICFITSNKYLSQKYGLGIRKLFLKNKILGITNFVFNVFDATVDSCVSVVKKSEGNDGYVTLREITNDDLLLNSLDDLLMSTSRGEIVRQNRLGIGTEKNFRLKVSDGDLEILEKLQSSPFTLDDICYVDTGVVVHSPHKNLKKNHFIKDAPCPLCKKFLEGRNIFRWLIKGHSYLDYQPELHHRPKMEELFEREKIVMRRVVSRRGFYATYDPGLYYVENGVILFTLFCNLSDLVYPQLNRYLTEYRIETSKMFSLKYILAVVNSRLMVWFFEKFHFDGLHIYPQHIRYFPIRKVSQDRQEYYILLVNKILAITKSDDYLKNPTKQTKVKEYEKQIDQVVYKLYDLTPEEIKIVEGGKKG